jgi:hypothetical protein
MAIHGLRASFGRAPQEGTQGLHQFACRHQQARPITKIKSNQVVLFFRDVNHWFGVPNSNITDNDTQFTGKKFLRFYDEYHIHVD